LGIFVSLGFYFIFKKGEIINYPSNGSDIVAFGDSLVEGVGSTSEGDFVSLLSSKIGEPIINLGHSGDTTVDGLNRINELDNYKPKIVILLLGGNDYLKKVPAVDTFKNLATIVENIQSRGSIVLLLGIRGGILSDPFESEFIKLKDKYGVAFVPDVLSGLIGNIKYMSDPIHPNNMGYKMIADKVYPILSKLIN